ncbi:MAG: hypothetical protein HY720_19455 [Planctomycetes bacterium]|nr:hypothetical protein [Planctomycetota bacterium]
MTWEETAMYATNKTFSRKQGQGMTEYIIIVVLVAIAVLALVKAFGSTVSEKFKGSTSTVSNQLDASGSGKNGPSGGNVSGPPVSPQ